MSSEAKVLKYLSSKRFCTISTVSKKGKPQSAFVQYASNGLDIIFETFDFSRKHLNIKNDARVAIVVASGTQRKEIQYEGVAKKLSGDEKRMYQELYFKKFPSERELQDVDALVFLKVTPKWIRYIDLNPEPLEEIEFNF